MKPSHDQVAAKLDAVEAELRKIGRWQTEPLPPEAYQNMGAFGMNTMAFTQWLQFVLLRNARAIVAQRGEFPSSSQVGVIAVREADTDPDLLPLSRMLCDFDALFGG
jgi:uncharacterized protein YqcC (DUF446 family)